MKKIYEFQDYSIFEPYLSTQLVKCHYELHHLQYVKNLKSFGIDDYNVVIHNPSQYDDVILNNALQVYNHNIFWQSMKLGTKNQCLDLDTIENFKKQANSLFGSGWAWILYDMHSKKITCFITGNAHIPAKHFIVLAVLDLWEHAYYLQYYSNRKEFINTFVDKLLNYDFIEQNLNSITA